MKALTVPDEVGVVWQVAPDKDPTGNHTDPVRPFLDRLVQKGYLLGDLVLPRELPRYLRCDPPDWSLVTARWKEDGTLTDGLRHLINIETTRAAIYHGIQEDQP